MGGIIVLSIIYWLAVGVIFLIGLVKLIAEAYNNRPLKPALRLLIISVIMLVIGLGTCAALMGSIGSMN